MKPESELLPTERNLCIEKLKYDNLHTTMKSFWTEAEWTKLTQKERVVSQLTLLKALEVGAKNTENKDAMVLIALLAYECAIHSYKLYLAELQANPTSGTIVAEFGRN